MKKLFRILFIKIPLTLAFSAFALTAWALWVVFSAITFFKETIEAIVEVSDEIWNRK